MSDDLLIFTIIAVLIILAILVRKLVRKIMHIAKGLDLIIEKSAERELKYGPSSRN